MIKICGLWESTKQDSDTQSGIIALPPGATLTITSQHTIVIVPIHPNDRRKNGPVADVYLGEKMERVTK
jgi:hypothetical protein